jgi:nitroreductase
LEATNLTATSLGLQGMKLIRISDQALRESLVPHSFNQRQVADASELLILCATTTVSEQDVDDYMQRIATARNQDIAALEGFKNMIGGYLNTITSEGKMQDWLSKQAYIALGTLLTACAMEKIDSCPMEGFKPDEISNALDLEAKGLFPVLLLPVGYRSEECKNQHLPKVRKSIDEFVITI